MAEITLVLQNATPSSSRGGQSFTVKVKASLTVQKVKAQIELQHGFPAGEQRIKFGGYFLDNRRTLASYHPQFPRAKMYFYCVGGPGNATGKTVRGSPGSTKGGGGVSPSGSSSGGGGGGGGGGEGGGGNSPSSSSSRVGQPRASASLMTNSTQQTSPGSGGKLAAPSAMAVRYADAGDRLKDAQSALDSELGLLDVLLSGLGIALPETPNYSPGALGTAAFASAAGGGGGGASSASGIAAAAAEEDDASSVGKHQASSPSSPSSPSSSLAPRSPQALQQAAEARAALKAAQAQKHLDAAALHHFKTVFAALDGNSDGYINCGDLTRLLEFQGPEGNLSVALRAGAKARHAGHLDGHEAVASICFGAMDSDGNGKARWSDFWSVVKPSVDSGGCDECDFSVDATRPPVAAAAAVVAVAAAAAAAVAVEEETPRAVSPTPAMKQPEAFGGGGGILKAAVEATMEMNADASDGIFAATVEAAVEAQSEEAQATSDTAASNLLAAIELDIADTELVIAAPRPSSQTAQQNPAMFGQGYVTNGQAFANSTEAIAHFKLSAPDKNPNKGLGAPARPSSQTAQQNPAMFGQGYVTNGQAFANSSEAIAHFKKSAPDKNPNKGIGADTAAQATPDTAANAVDVEEVQAKLNSSVLSPEKIEEIKALFAKADENSNGLLSKAELAFFLSKNVLDGGGSSIVHVGSVAQLMKLCDGDGDGNISVEEFISMFEKHVVDTENAENLVKASELPEDESW